MAVGIRNQQDFVLGALYVLAGGGFAVVSRAYDMGTLSYMGPGFFPFALGVLLAGIGTVIMLRSLHSRAAKVALGRWNLRPLVWMIGSVVVFGLLLRPLGLILSVLALVIMASLASREFTWKTTLLNALAMIVINWVGLVWGLSIQIPVLPAFLGG